MIGVGEVQLGESPNLAKPIQWFTNQRQQILVFDSNIVEILIINAKAEASIWLLIEDDKCSNKGLGRPNKAVGQVGLNISFQDF